jgi:hypothetical protein
MGYMRYEGYV